MKKLKKFTIGSSVVLSKTQMMGVLGGDTDPNVCHSKTSDDVCSGFCYQYVGGKGGVCKWDFSDHRCNCHVFQ